jgi:pilus assembly protein CpaC
MRDFGIWRTITWLTQGAYRTGILLVSLIVIMGTPLGGAQSQELEGSAQVQRRVLVPSPKTATVRLSVPEDEEEIFHELAMEAGKSVYVRTEYRVKRVSVGAPEILDVVVISPRKLQFVAKSPGATNVVLWDTNNEPQAAVDVHVGTANSHIAAELRRVLDSEDIQVESAGRAVVLKGSVSSALAMEQALAVSRAFFSKDPKAHVINMLEVGGNHQVMIEVKIAELSRTLRHQLGTNFRAIIGSDGEIFEVFNFLDNLTSFDSRELTFDLDKFKLTGLEEVFEISERVSLGGGAYSIGTGIYEVFFDVLEQNGLGKILAEPTLVARSGETARFLVGGEVPIPVAQGGAFGSITVEFKAFGVAVDFTPTVLSPERIHLSVSPEVSEPDFTLGTAVGGILVPGFNSRRASTGVVLADGQSFAIAGLLRDDLNEVVREYPVLGDIPILGGLFRSSQFLKEETELVMIVTPRLVKPLGPGPHSLPTDHFVEPSAFEFYLLGRLEGRAEPPPPAETVTTRPPHAAGLIGGAGHRITAVPEGSKEQ